MRIMRHWLCLGCGYGTWRFNALYICPHCKSQSIVSEQAPWYSEEEMKRDVEDREKLAERTGHGKENL